MDLKELARVLGDDFVEVMRPALEGTEEDLKAYGLAIAEDSLRIAQGKAAEDVASHLKAQILLLSERGSIRIKSGMLDWLTGAVTFIAKLALSAGESYLRSKIGG